MKNKDYCQKSANMSQALGYISIWLSHWNLATDSFFFFPLCYIEHFNSFIIKSWDGLMWAQLLPPPSPCTLPLPRLPPLNSGRAWHPNDRLMIRYCDLCNKAVVWNISLSSPALILLLFLILPLRLHRTLPSSSAASTLPHRSYHCLAPCPYSSYSPLFFFLFLHSTYSSVSLLP